MLAIEEKDPLEELTREDDLAQKLVERLAELGLALAAGTAVPPGEISEGLRLLTQYRQLHAERFTVHLGKEARGVAMPTCFEHLDAVDRAPKEADARRRGLSAALDAYGEGRAGARDALARELGTYTQQEFDLLRYEREYPLSCLLSALPDAAAARVRTGFDRSAARLADLEGHIGRLLGTEREAAGRSTIPVRCSRPDCSARGTATTYPSTGGHLALRPPAGWSAVAHPPLIDRGTTVSTQVDFACPAHSTGAVKGPELPRPERARAPAEPDLSTCPCCDPIPLQDA